MPCLIAILLLSTLLPTSLLAGQAEGEILRAKVEDLVERLKLRDPQAAARLLAAREPVAAQAGPFAEQGLSGIALGNASVRLSGQPEALLQWLAEGQRIGFACTPPILLRGERPELEITLWRVQGTLAAGTTESDLRRIKDNLLWFDRQRESFGPISGILEALLSAEALLPAAATWQGGELRASGTAADQVALDRFLAELNAQAAKLPAPPRVETGEWRVGQQELGASEGLLLQEIEAADALLLAADVGQTDVVFASRESLLLSGSIPAKDRGLLLSGLLAKLNLPNRFTGKILTVSGQPGPAGPEPPGVSRFPETAIDLSFRAARPENIIRLLADASGLSLVPPEPSGLRLTLRVRMQPARFVAAAVLWALGLAPAESERLLALFPAGRAPAPTTAAGEVVNLFASEAPLSALVEGLAGTRPIFACGAEDPAVSLQLRQVFRQELLELLLASHNKRLVREEADGFVLPRDGTPARTDLERCRSRHGKPGTGPSKLLAILRQKDEFRALVRHGAEVRWVRAGDKLPDGSEVRRVFAGRLVLRTTTGDSQSLEFVPAAAPPEQLLHPPGITSWPLSRLRLAGTAVLPDGAGRASAMLVDPEGNSFLVRRGHPAGRRCGQVEEVLPGMVRIKLGCPKTFDPAEVRLYLGAPGRIDSAGPDR